MMTRDDKLKEVKQMMNLLGYPAKGTVELDMIDDDRAKVIYDGHLMIGIYDFIRHTFVD